MIISNWKDILTSSELIILEQVSLSNFSHQVDTHLQALELARQFNLESLQKNLIDQLVESITLRNFSDFFNLSTRYENVKLQKTYKDFLLKNSEEVIKSDHFPKLTLVSCTS